LSSVSREALLAVENWRHKVMGMVRQVLREGAF
jgi:hypothetical protein